jgi:hypothetical protein
MLSVIILNVVRLIVMEPLPHLSSDLRGETKVDIQKFSEDKLKIGKSK